MKEKIIELFKEKFRNSDTLFTPPIKVKTNADMIWIYSLYCTKYINSCQSYHVKMEIGFNEAKPVNLHLLSEEVLKAIWLRLMGMAKPVIEKIR